MDYKKQRAIYTARKRR